MKGIIVDIEESYAIVLDKKGCYLKIKNTGDLQIGCEITIPSKVIYNKKTFMKVASIAAMFLVIFSVFAGIYAYNTPYTYVNVDINPSVEITVNIFDRIIHVEALNTDGKKLLIQSEYKNASVDEGVKKIIKHAVDKGYLKPDTDNAVVFTVTCKRESTVEEIQKEIRVSAIEEFKKDNIKSEVLLEKASVSKRDNAKKSGISPGKMLLIERMQETAPNTKIEDYKDKPVKEILKAIKHSLKVGKEKEKGSKQNGNKEDNGNHISPTPIKSTARPGPALPGKGKGGIKEQNKGDDKKHPGIGNGKKNDTGANSDKDRDTNRDKASESEQWKKWWEQYKERNEIIRAKIKEKIQDKREQEKKEYEKREQERKERERKEQERREREKKEHNTKPKINYWNQKDTSDGKNKDTNTKTKENAEDKDKKGILENKSMIKYDTVNRKETETETENRGSSKDKKEFDKYRGTGGGSGFSESLGSKTKE